MVRVTKTREAPLVAVLDTSTARGKLLAAAAGLFAEHGIQTPTVEDILQSAGVSRRTFYKYFTSRDDVLVELHRTLSDLFLMLMRAAASSATSQRHRITSTIDILLTAAQRGGGLFRVLQAEAMRPGSRLSIRRQEVFGELAAMHADALREAGLPPRDPLYVHGVLSGVEAILHRGAAEGPLDDSRIERIRREMTSLMATAFGVS